MFRVPDSLPTCKAGTAITKSEEDAYDKAERHWYDYYQREVLIKAHIYTIILKALPQRKCFGNHQDFSVKV